MKSYSTQKKSRIQPELTHKIQSKLLISSVSKQTLPSSMISKYNPSKQEQMLQKQYNMKFMTDRKRTSSAKKLSATKRNSKDVRKENKMEGTNQIQPKRLFGDDQEYRQKYYHLHQTHLRDREKWIGEAEKLFTVKEAICDFLTLPSQSRGKALSNVLDNDKISKQIGRYVENQQKGKVREEILQEVMRILQCEYCEDIPATIRARVDRFRNLDQCTFKILELESTNKKIVVEFEERVRRIKKEVEESTEREMIKMGQELEMAKRSRIFADEELEMQKDQYQLLLEDLGKLLRNEQQSQQKWVSGRGQVLQLYKLIHNLSHKLSEIEVDAEQNMFKLLKSNEEMVKLQQLMSLIKDDMNRQLQEEEQNNQQNLCQISQLNRQLEEVEGELERQRQKGQKIGMEKERIVKELEDQKLLMSKSLGISEGNNATITLKIQDLIRQLSFRKEKQAQLEQSLSEKDELIGDITRQSQKLSKTIQDMKESTKTALFQKEQYKFLLNNLRDQVTQMKKQHGDQITRVIREKDQEIVRSNKDILQSYGDLKDEYEVAKGQFTKLRLVYEENKVELIFIKNKEEQVSKTLRERDEESVKIKEENERYKKYLKEIQTSFKEMVDMQQVGSKKISVLQSENQHNLILINAYQTKNEDLQNSNNELIQIRNQLRTQLQKSSGDVKELRDERVKLERVNVELRLETIAKQNDINKLAEDLKNAEKEVKSGKLVNEKVNGQLNSVTRKLVMYRIQIRKKCGEKYRKCKEETAALRQVIGQLEKNIKKEAVENNRILCGFMEKYGEEMIQLENRLRQSDVQSLKQLSQRPTEEDLNQLKHKYEQELNIKQKQQEQNMQQLQQKMKREKEQIIVKFSEQISQLKQKFIELQQKERELRQKQIQIGELKQSEEKMKIEQQHHHKKLMELNSINEQKLQQMRLGHRKQMEDLESNYQSDIKSINQKVAHINGQFQDKNQHKILELQEEHQQKIKLMEKSLLEKHGHQLDVVKKRYQEYVKQFEQEIASLKEEVLQLKQQMKKQQQQAKDKDKIHLEEITFNELPSIQSQQMSSYSDACSQHPSEIDEVEIKTTQEMGVSCLLLQKCDHHQVKEKLVDLSTRVQELHNQKQAIVQSTHELQYLCKEQIQNIFQKIETSILKEEQAEENKSWNGDGDAILEDDQSDKKSKQSQGEIVNTILQLLLDSDTEIPTFTEWQKIKANFLAIRRKLTKKQVKLNLDLSAIDNRDFAMQSPNSQSISQNDYFSKRFASEPNEVLDVLELREKETNRSEKMTSSNLLLQNLRKENQELKHKILTQTEDKVELTEVIEELKISMQEMERKLVALENETNINVLQINYKKLLDSVLQENQSNFEQTCRILMKMLRFKESEVQSFSQQLNHKKTKRKSGFLSFIFNQQ